VPNRKTVCANWRIDRATKHLGLKVSTGGGSLVDLYPFRNYELSTPATKQRLSWVGSLDYQTLVSRKTVRRKKRLRAYRNLKT
jgi:hypothetical protein